MRRYFDPIIMLGIVSICLLGLLTFLLSQNRPSFSREPLKMYCAAALKPAAEAIANDYEKETGIRTEFQFGNSEQILSDAALSKTGDLFLPADDSFVRRAESQGLVTTVHPVAKMKLVVLTRPGNPFHIARFEDLLNTKLKLGQANPDAAAVGKVTRDHLRKLGLWDSLAANTHAMHSTVSDAANAVKIGSNDAAIVWDAVASQYVGQKDQLDLGIVELPELTAAVGNVEIAILKTAASENAIRFVEFFNASDRGQSILRANGFTNLAAGLPWKSSELAQ